MWVVAWSRTCLLYAQLPDAAMTRRAWRCCELGICGIGPRISSRSSAAARRLRKEASRGGLLLGVADCDCVAGVWVGGWSLVSVPINRAIRRCAMIPKAALRSVPRASNLGAALREWPLPPLTKRACISAAFRIHGTRPAWVAVRRRLVSSSRSEETRAFASGETSDQAESAGKS